MSFTRRCMQDFLQNLIQQLEFIWQESGRNYSVKNFLFLSFFSCRGIHVFPCSGFEFILSLRFRVWLHALGEPYDLCFLSINKNLISHSPFSYTCIYILMIKIHQPLPQDTAISRLPLSELLGKGCVINKVDTHTSPLKHCPCMFGNKQWRCTPSRLPLSPHNGWAAALQLHPLVNIEQCYVTATIRAINMQQTVKTKSTQAINP